MERSRAAFRRRSRVFGLAMGERSGRRESKRHCHRHAHQSVASVCFHVLKNPDSRLDRCGTEAAACVARRLLLLQLGNSHDVIRLFGNEINFVANFDL